MLARAAYLGQDISSFKGVSTHSPRLFGPEVTCLAPGFNLNLVAPGQCHCNRLTEQGGQHTFSIIVEPGTGDLESLHQQEDGYTCMLSISQEDRVSERTTNHGTQPIPPTGCSNGLPQGPNSQFPLYCSWKPDPEVLAVDALDGSLSIHVSPICSSSLSTQDRGACDSTFSCPSVVEPNLVSSASKISDRSSNYASSNSRHNVTNPQVLFFSRGPHTKQKKKRPEST